MNKIKKLIPLILSINMCYAQDSSYSEQPSDGQESSDTNSILQNIESYLQNLGSYLGYDVTTKPTTTTTDTLLDNGSTQKKLENYTVQIYFGFINYSWSYPYFLPANSNSYASVFNKLCGTVFSSSSFTPQNTSKAVDLPYDTSSGGSSSGSSNAFSKNPVSQYLYNLSYITPMDACITQPADSSTPTDWNTNTTNYSYCEGLVLAKALGLDVQNSDIVMKTSSSSSTINNLADKIQALKFSYPTNNPSNNNNTALLQQLDSTVFIGPLMYDTSSAATSGSGNSSSIGLTAANQLEAAQNFVRYITGGMMPKVFANYQDLSNAFNGTYNAKNVSSQMNYFKPFAKYILDFRVYAARSSIAIQNIYDSLAYRMNLNNGSSSSSSSDGSSSSQQSSQALNEYVMASYRLYNPNAQSNSSGNSSDATSSSSGEGSLQTTAWQDMINTASPATVQKEVAILLAEINYQLYQMRQQQEKMILTNSVFLLNNLTEPSISVPSPQDASE
jgi:intracellular multiplication protein IcmX